MDKTFSRRAILKVGAAGLFAAATPEIAMSKSPDGLIELRAQQTKKRLAGIDASASDLWLYNGKSPGPEIRVVQGERVRVRFINELDEPTSIHWHGIRIDNAMDGVSGLTQDPVQPGETFLYDFVVPDGGTFWYHAHNRSWEQVARGLYGPLIVEELKPSFDRAHDLTLVIDDWRLDNDGDLHLASLGAFGDWSHAGRLGNWLTVNGQSEPKFTLNAGENYRLRLINAANARVLQISPKAIGAKLLGFDGFVFNKPREYEFDVLPLAPAQRVDLLINGGSADKISLNDIGEFALEELSGRRALSAAKFEFVRNNRQQPVEPIVLNPNNIKLPDLVNAKQVQLIMTGGAMGQISDMTYLGRKLTREDIQQSKQVWAFNGIANLAQEPLFRVERGTTVVIKTENQTGWLHGMHAHGHHFQIISKNGEELRVKNWRDTFIINRDEIVEIAFVADNPGKWLLHCHMLEHAAAGMRTWFEVTLLPLRLSVSDRVLAPLPSPSDALDDARRLP